MASPIRCSGTTSASTSRSFPSGALAHGFALLLDGARLWASVFGLYLLVGAVRWLEGRPAINDHARAHLGWLLTGLALTLVWGYVLEPYELVAGLGATARPAQWSATDAGVAAPGGRGARDRGALGCVGASSPPRPGRGRLDRALVRVTGRTLDGAAGDGRRRGAGRAPARWSIAQPHGLWPRAVAEDRMTRAASPEPPRLPSLWNPGAIGRVAAGGLERGARGRPGGADGPGQAAVRSGSAVRAAPSGTATLGRRDRRRPHSAKRGAAALLSRAGIRSPGPDRRAISRAGPDQAFRPDAPRFRLQAGRRSGHARSALAAAADARLGATGRTAARGACRPGARVDWHISPDERLDGSRRSRRGASRCRASSTASWSGWSTGTSRRAPFRSLRGSQWRGREIGALQAGFLGTVEPPPGNPDLPAARATTRWPRPGPPWPRAWSSRRPPFPRRPPGRGVPARAVPGPGEAT